MGTQRKTTGNTGSGTYTKAVLESVENYIKKFPVMESYYMREKCKCEFLASNLNIHSMYELYQSQLIRISSIPVLI